ncbi:hypothetical protein JGT96_20395 [Enterobacter hormaechei]|uniref:hypothetical protein n=1 Tax=Enterobacter hormaechei TaxID=158836 RepID=UPI0018EE3AA1|nr:hypothetical protein [Enterobacter hormaechei]MBJ6592986.1 hypothetical protein [Enterobacter hormaechei]
MMKLLKNKSFVFSTTSLVISCIALAYSFNTAMKAREGQLASTSGTDSFSVKAENARFYGFVCNKEGELWEIRREKIDVTEAVFVNGKLVHCVPEKNDFAIDDKSYFMSDEGSYILDGKKYPRVEIAKQWFKSQVVQ